MDSTFCSTQIAAPTEQQAKQVRPTQHGDDLAGALASAAGLNQSNYGPTSNGRTDCVQMSDERAARGTKGTEESYKQSSLLKGWQAKMANDEGN